MSPAKCGVHALRAVETGAVALTLIRMAKPPGISMATKKAGTLDSLEGSSLFGCCGVANGRGLHRIELLSY